MPAPRRNILLFLHFPFVLEVGPDVCPLSSNYQFYPYHELWSICKYEIMFMPMLELVYLALLWENINNDTLNTSG